MHKVLILEDEITNSQLLRQLIEEYIQDVEIIAECKSVKEAYNEVIKYDFLTILLDIELGEESGLELIELLKHRNDAIVVVSAFPEYAIQAFRLNIVDFVSKPIRIIELQEAFERVKKKTTISDDKIKVGIQLFNKTIFVDQDIIQSIQSNLTGTKIFLRDGTSINSIERIGQLEARINEQVFFRIDKSIIINLQFIRQHTLENGQLTIELSTGESLQVSRRRKALLLKHL